MSKTGTGTGTGAGAGIPFQDYIIKQNHNLHEENRALVEEVRELQSQNKELEEQHDQLERQTVQLKQYVRNFHDVAEIHREIADTDLRYIRSILKREEREALITATGATHPIIPPDYLCVFGIIMFTIMSLLVKPDWDTYIYGIILTGLTSMYYQHVLKRTDYALAQIRKQTECDRQEIHKLVALRRSKAHTLKDLEQTMDIIGKFIDDAL